MALEYRLKSDSVAVVATLKKAGVQPDVKVLDFGCGPGQVCTACRKDGR